MTDEDGGLLDSGLGTEEEPLLDVEQIEKLEEGDKGKLSRLALALILLLLLLLCVVTTVVDVWVTTPTQKRVSVARNLECLQCHVELIPQFTMDDVHNPFATKRCTTCHTPHGKEVVTKTTYSAAQRWERVRTLIEWLPLRLACEVGAAPAALVDDTAVTGKTETSSTKVKGKDSNLILPEDELCWMCHGDIGPQLSMTFPHSPFKSGYCTACHHPHASNNKPLLQIAERDLCVTCHPVGDWMNRAQVHPPAGARYCTTCHHPHASEYKGILVARQRELCFTCHPSVAYLSLKGVQHYPFLYDDCTGCHEPHGSDYNPLLIEYQPGLCYECHPSIQNDFLKASHHPVGSVQLNCGDCHNPHAADYDFLLDAADNEFCYGCHTRAIKATYEPSAHRDVLCIRCHTPHGSSYTPLLRRSNPDLCLECHGWIDHKNTHPFRPAYWDSHNKKPLTCTSTCHNPHGTRYDYMVVGWDCPADGQCMQCHTTVGIKF